MSATKNPAEGPGVIQIERHGEIAIIVPTSDVESMQWDHIEQAAEMVLAPLKKEPTASVIVDLSKVSYFGSIFLSLLLRCHKQIKSLGGEIVLCGATDRARELLRLTALDTIWAIYDTRDQALQALS